MKTVEEKSKECGLCADIMRKGKNGICEKCGHLFLAGEIAARHCTPCTEHLKHKALLAGLKQEV